MAQRPVRRRVRGRPAATCDDGNPCTANTCNRRRVGSEPERRHERTARTPACATGRDLPGGCLLAGVSPTCDDNNPCTTTTVMRRRGARTQRRHERLRGRRPVRRDRTARRVRRGRYAADVRYRTRARTTTATGDGVRERTRATTRTPARLRHVRRDRDCQGGACLAGTPLTCTDSNPCDGQQLQSATGCVTTNDNTNVCADATCSTGPRPARLVRASRVRPPTCNDNNRARTTTAIRRRGARTRTTTRISARTPTSATEMIPSMRVRACMVRREVHGLNP